MTVRNAESDEPERVLTEICDSNEALRKLASELADLLNMLELNQFCYLSDQRRYKEALSAARAMGLLEPV